MELKDIRDPNLVIFAKKKWASLRHSLEFVLKLLQRLYSRLRIYSGSCQVHSLNYIKILHNYPGGRKLEGKYKKNRDVSSEKRNIHPN